MVDVFGTKLRHNLRNILIESVTHFGMLAVRALKQQCEAVSGTLQ